ncbi:MAG: hypothetical protein QOH06_689 [Acidobacteriota bacterium]|jgi:hypothetical protein|nr:hypothetical protein [Acidobacteriota bacterium]
MTREEYEKRLRALEEQHRADIALLNAAHETRLRSLARLWQDAAEWGQDGAAPGAASATAPANTATGPASKPALARFTVLNDLEEVFPGLPDVFDRRDVVRALGYTPARATLTRAFAMLQEDGLITTDTQSMGGNANRYRKLPRAD